MRGWKKHSPADSLVISPAFELMGRQPVNEFPGANKAQHYLTFLKESLDGKLPGFGEETSEPQSTGGETLSNSGTASINGLNVVLTREKPEQEILNIFRTPEHSFQDYTVIEIDTTAFKNGGTLSIDISVGNAEPMGSFDLYDGKTELPTKGMPEGALASAWDIPPGKKEQLSIILTEVRHLSWVLLVVGSVRKGASTRFSLQFPWNLCQQKTTKSNSTLL